MEPFESVKSKVLKINEIFEALVKKIILEFESALHKIHERLQNRFFERSPERPKFYLNTVQLAGQSQNLVLPCEPYSSLCSKHTDLKNRYIPLRLWRAIVVSQEDGSPRESVEISRYADLNRFIMY